MIVLHEIVKIEGLRKEFPGVVALDDVNLSIRKGEVHALVGENGAGKSTLIKVLAGVYKPDKGDIFIDYKNVEFNHPLEALKSGISVTFQDLSLFPNLSVAENIATSKKIEAGDKLINWTEFRKIAKEAIETLDVNIEVNQKLGYLSIGNRQMIAIARAVVNDAKLLILDEPTASLAKEEISALFKIIDKLKEQEISVLFVSHKLDEIFEVADRISVLRDGKYIGTYNKNDITEDELISYMVGRKVIYSKYTKRKSDKPMLKVNNLSKKNNFKDISFTLNKGEILGITGLVGAGRTEVVQAIFGNNIPDEGKVYLEGEELDLSSTAKAMEAGISYVPENRQEQGLVLGKTLADNITVTIIDKLKNKFGLIDNSQKESIVNKWIDKLNIKPPYPEMDIDQFSGGNQQKAVIAKWLAFSPKLLIVDEPTQGIDIGAKSEIHKLLRDLAEDGIGIIVVSSELPEILAIADRTLVMKRGRISHVFEGDNMTQEEILNKAITTTTN
jgi:ABC-type sugar transport system ATPase subunit